MQQPRRAKDDDDDDETWKSEIVTLHVVSLSPSPFLGTIPALPCCTEQKKAYRPGTERSCTSIVPHCDDNRGTRSVSFLYVTQPVGDSTCFPFGLGDNDDDGRDFYDPPKWETARETTRKLKIKTS